MSRYQVLAAGTRAVTRGYTGFGVQFRSTVGSSDAREAARAMVQSIRVARYI